MVDVTTPVADGTDIGPVIGGTLHGLVLVKDTAGADAMGLVTASPAATSMLGRLKAIADGIGAATYYPATQPVSGAVSITGGVAVTGTFWQATQPVSGTFWQATQPVSAASLPLPAGAATSAKQDTGNTSLGSIDTKLSGTIATAPVAGENHIGAVGGHSARVTQTFNRPANTTAYTSGDLVANSATAGSVTPISLALARVNGGTGCIRRVTLSTTKTGLAGTDVFRVHFFATTPTVDNGDNGAFAVNGRASGYLGYCDVTLDRVFNDGALGIGVPAAGAEITFVAGGATTAIFALIEVRGAYTPASAETFVVAAEVFRD